MRRLKNVILVVVLIFSLMFIGSINNHDVATDSGFDTGYGSGGSWGSGGSSWGGGSSGFGHSKSYDFVIICLILVIIVTLMEEAYRRSHVLIKNDFDINKIKPYIPDFELKKFLLDRYDDFVDIQLSWMNFNYERLRLKLTDELYNQYYMQLASLEVQNRKNIMSNFKLNGGRIVSFKCENNLATIKIELDVSFYDYITENNKIVRGKSNRKVNMVYYLTFVSRVSGNTNECPHCGAPITNAASQTCSYCKCVISSVSSDWVLAKKEVISQR